MSIQVHGWYYFHCIKLNWSSIHNRSEEDWNLPEDVLLLYYYSFNSILLIVLKENPEGHGQNKFSFQFKIKEKVHSKLCISAIYVENLSQKREIGLT